MANKDTVRTTIVIPGTLDQNLEALRMISGGGESKNDLIVKVLRDGVEKAGLNPDKKPTIKVTYEE